MGNPHMQLVIDEDTENKIHTWCFGHYHKSVAYMVYAMSITVEVAVILNGLSQFIILDASQLNFNQFRALA